MSCWVIYERGNGREHYDEEKAVTRILQSIPVPLPPIKNAFITTHFKLDNYNLNLLPPQQLQHELFILSREFSLCFTLRACKIIL